MSNVKILNWLTSVQISNSFNSTRSWLRLFLWFKFNSTEIKTFQSVNLHCSPLIIVELDTLILDRAFLFNFESNWILQWFQNYLKKTGNESQNRNIFFLVQMVCGFYFGLKEKSPKKKLPVAKVFKSDNGDSTHSKCFMFGGTNLRNQSHKRTPISSKETIQHSSHSPTS